MREKLGLRSYKPTLLVEQVADVLMDAILKGNLKGGEKLAETRLQEQFGVSRTPLREALRELQKKGFVEIIPRRGAYVRQLSAKDVDDTFPVRAVLEGLAARQALERMKPAVIKALEKSMAGMERAAEKDDPRLYLNHHVDYHETYIRASGNDVLVDVLTRLRMHTIWHRYYFQYHGEDFAKSLAVHRKILGMMADASTDPDSIERVVKNHIVAGYRRFLEYIREND